MIIFNIVKKKIAKRRNTISTIALNKANSLNKNSNGDYLLLTNDKKLNKMTANEINEINNMGKPNNHYYYITKYYLTLSSLIFKIKTRYIRACRTGTRTEYARFFTQKNSRKSRID